MTPPSEAPEGFRLAQAAQRAGQLDLAAEGYAATIEAFPDAAPAYHNLAGVLLAQGQRDRAEALLRRALARWPDDPEFAFNLGVMRLAAGDYAEGLPLYESRRRVGRDRVRTPRMSFPEWTGEPIGSLLLFPEQGLGDQIQFARYVAPLKARGVAVTLACSPVLARLFEPLEVATVAAAGEVPLPRHDAWALVGSLPLRFGSRLDSLPPPARLRAASPSGSGGIGVVTRGSPTNANDANRSLPPAAAAELLALPGAVSVHPEDTGATDLQATADIVAGLDLVITVDTAAAHLAASLGTPTWILLPARGTDWRWLRDRSDSPWYPAARLFRQGTPGDWAGVIAQVRQALDQRSAPAP